MKFALVIIETPLSRRSIAADRVGHRTAIENWMRGLGEAKILVGGEAFETEAQPPATVRRTADGAVTVTDEPFAGSEDTLGGYVVVEAVDRAAAVEIAKTWPATGEAIEVRPVWQPA